MLIRRPYITYANIDCQLDVEEQTSVIQTTNVFFEENT